MNRSICLLAGIVATGLTIPCVADAESEHVRFYVLPSQAVACPEVEEFPSRLQSRSSLLRPATPGEPAIVYGLSVSMAASRFRGDLSIRDSNGHTTNRSVEGANCTGVVDALAFIAALLVEKLQERSAPAARAAEGLPSKAYFGVTTQMELNSATKPTLTPSPRIAVVVGVRTRGYTPEWRAGLRLQTPSRERTVYGDAVFDGWAAYLTISPLQWPSGGQNFLRPAIGFEWGRLRGQGENTVEAASVSVRWLATTLGLEGELQLLGPLSGSIATALVVPLSRHEFYFDSLEGRQPAFSIPAIGVSLAVGLMARLR